MSNCPFCQHVFNFIHKLYFDLQQLSNILWERVNIYTRIRGYEFSRRVLNESSNMYYNSLINYAMTILLKPQPSIQVNTGCVEVN